MMQVVQKEEMKEMPDAHRALNQERNQLDETIEMMKGLLSALETAKKVQSENDNLKKENEALRAQFQEEKEQRLKAEMQLNEMSKLSASVAGRASQDEVQKALRVFVNKSKRKKLEKRIMVKEMVLERDKYLSMIYEFVKNGSPEGVMLNQIFDYLNEALPKNKDAKSQKRFLGYLVNILKTQEKIENEGKRWIITK